MRSLVIVFVGVLFVALLSLGIFALRDADLANRQAMAEDGQPGSSADSSGLCPPSNETVGVVRFGEGITLANLPPLPDRITDSLDLQIGWAIAEAVPRQTYSFALHVKNSEGDLVAQVDYSLPEQRVACVPAHIDVSTLPVGDYSLLAVVYHLADGIRLPGTMIETGEEIDTLVVGDFSVIR